MFISAFVRFALINIIQYNKTTREKRYEHNTNK